MKRINDAPHIYCDVDILNGTLEEVSQSVLKIKERLKNAYEERNKTFPEAKFTPFEDYKVIKLNSTIDYDGLVINIVCYREETEEEIKAEKEMAEKRKLASIKAAEKRKENKEKKELALLEKLKNKYEGNISNTTI